MGKVCFKLTVRVCFS